MLEIRGKEHHQDHFKDNLILVKELNRQQAQKRVSIVLKAFYHQREAKKLPPSDKTKNFKRKKKRNKQNIKNRIKLSNSSSSRFFHLYCRKP